MINTIFYFPQAKLTYSDYAAAVQNGEISGRTIVLDKVSGKIFNQGKEYGYSKQEIDESVDRKIDDVKNDMDDAVDGLNNTLDELNNTLDELNDHIDDVNNNLDDVINDLDDSIQDKVEDMISDSEWMQQNWPQGVTQYDSGWNENVKAYLQTVGLWDYGDDGSIVTKWSQLRQSVNNVSSEVNQVTRQGGRLDTLQSAINQEITDRGAAITQLSNTYTNTDAQTKKVLEWMYSGLKSSASANKSFNELYSAANSGDTTAIAGLRTDITNQLGNYVASTDLSSRVEGVLKSGAGVTSLANLAQKSDITSATTTLVNTYQLAGLQTSLSGLQSKADANEARLDIVTKLGENNTYTYNKATLDSAVAGLMAESNSATNLYLAGLQVSSGNGQASTELASAINNNKADIARLATKITGNSSDAAVEAKLNGMSASLVTTSTLDTALVNVLATNNSGSAASIKTLAGDSSAVTSLGSRVDGVEATIDAIVDGSGSSVMIKADKIDLSGLTTAEEVIIKNGNNLEAGMTNGNSETVDGVYRDGVRIWAGTPGTVSNRTSLANCPFYVTNAGVMRADNANVSGTITATDGTIGGFEIGQNYIGEVNGTTSSWSGLKIYNDGRISVGNYSQGVDYALRVAGGVQLIGQGKDILINAMADGGTVLLMGNIKMLLTNPSDSSTTGNVYTDNFSNMKLVESGKTVRNQIEVKTSSFTLPNDPPIGTMFFVKRVYNDITITTGNAYVLNGSNNGTLWEPNTTNTWSETASMILFYLGSIDNIKYWTVIYSN